MLTDSELRIPTTVSSDHGVEDDQDFAHTRDDGHLGGFTSRTQALVELSDWVIGADCSDGHHVQRRAYLATSAKDRSDAFAFARIACYRRHTDECGDALAVQRPQLGQITDKGALAHRAHPLEGAQQIFPGSPQRRALNVLPDLTIHIGQQPLVEGDRLGRPPTK